MNSIRIIAQQQAPGTFTAMCPPASIITQVEIATSGTQPYNVSVGDGEGDAYTYPVAPGSGTQLFPGSHGLLADQSKPGTLTFTANPVNALVGWIAVDIDVQSPPPPPGLDPPTVDTQTRQVLASINVLRLGAGLPAFPSI